jgi:hypothetical protein
MEEEEDAIGKIRSAKYNNFFFLFLFFLLQKLISGEEHGAFILLAQKGVLLISPLPNNPKCFSQIIVSWTSASV